MSKPHRILAALSESPLAERLEEIFRLGEAQVGRALDVETALALGLRQPFDLIVSDLPLRGAGLIDFVDSLRGPGTLSEGCPTVLLAPRALGTTSAADGDGVEGYASPRALLRAVAGLLQISDRVRRHLLVQVDIEIDSATIRRAVQTENISASGMLLKTQRLVPVGSVVPFILDLPYDPEPVHGRAEVVRHAEPQNEGLRGMGVRFVELAGDAGERLRGFVDFER